MPSSKQRHRLEIHEDVYSRLTDLATREGYPVSRFADKLLLWAMDEYPQQRRIGREPLAGTFVKGFRNLLNDADKLRTR